MSKTMTVPVSTLQPHPENENIYGVVTADDKLKDSIRTVGLMQPLVVTLPNEEGMRTIVAGHRRFDALVSLGVSDVRVEEHEFEDEEELMQALVGSNQARNKTNEDVKNELLVLTNAQKVLASETYTEEWNDVPVDELAGRLGRSVRTVKQLLYIYKPTVQAKALARLEQAGGTEADVNKVKNYWDQVRSAHARNEFGTSPAINAIKDRVKAAEKEVRKRSGFKQKREPEPETTSGDTGDLNAELFFKNPDGFVTVGFVEIAGESHEVGLLYVDDEQVPRPAVNLTPRGSSEAPEITGLPWWLVMSRIRGNANMDVKLGDKQPATLSE